MCASDLTVEDFDTEHMVSKLNKINLLYLPRLTHICFVLILDSGCRYAQEYFRNYASKQQGQTNGQIFLRASPLSFNNAYLVLYRALTLTHNPLGKIEKPTQSKLGLLNSCGIILHFFLHSLCVLCIFSLLLEICKYI